MEKGIEHHFCIAFRISMDQTFKKILIQEVLERSIAQLDSKLSELDQAKITITNQENMIRDLTTKLHTLHKEDLENSCQESRKAENSEPENVGPVRCETLNSLADVLPSFREESQRGETPFGEDSIAKPLTKMENTSRQKWGSNGQAFRVALAHRAPNPPQLAPACRITMAARAAKLRDHDNKR